MEAETQSVHTLIRTDPGQHGGATCRGQKTGLHSGLRAADSAAETGQMAEALVQRGQQAGAAGVPGRSRAEDPGGVGDRGRAAAARRRLHGRLQKQGGVLCEAKQGGAESRLHEGKPGLRGLVLRSAGSVFCSS